MTFSCEQQDISKRLIVSVVLLMLVVCFCLDGLAQTALPVIRIEKIEDASLGQHQLLDVVLESGAIHLGGFDFLIAYDSAALTFQGVIEGEALFSETDGCAWEYFLSLAVDPEECEGDCPDQMVRIVSIAETNNGPFHPSCFLPSSLPATLFTLDFLVTDDTTRACDFVPIQFFWIDCGDNSLSNVTGDSLLLSDIVYDYDGALISATSPFPTLLGAQDTCLNHPEPGHDPPTRSVDFHNGGIEISCLYPVDVEDYVDDIPSVDFETTPGYPNPFGNLTQIGFSLPVRDEVTVTIYNVLGQRILQRTVVYPAGEHLFTWDGTNESGSRVPNSVYYARIATRNWGTETRKLVLIR